MYRAIRENLRFFFISTCIDFDDDSQTDLGKMGEIPLLGRAPHLCGQMKVQKGAFFSGKTRTHCQFERKLPLVSYLEPCIGMQHAKTDDPSAAVAPTRV